MCELRIFVRRLTSKKRQEFERVCQKTKQGCGLAGPPFTEAEFFLILASFKDSRRRLARDLWRIYITFAIMLQ